MVDAGANATIRLPANSAALDGTVTDDGLPEGSTVTVTWSVADGPGAVDFADANAEDTTATFTDAGVYVLQLTASDSELEGSDTVEITVETPIPGAPTADNLSVSTTVDTPVAITLTGSDPDGDALTFTVASDPTNGALSGTPPDVTYTPNGGYIGPDSFTYTASDGALESAPATVTIDVGEDAGGGGEAAYWTFDEASGTVAADSSGNGNDATITGAEHVPGVNGTALDFRGFDDRVVVDDETGLNITGTEISLVAWINPRNGGKNNFSRIISKRVNEGNGEVFGMLLRDYRLRFHLDGGAANNGQEMDSAHVVRLDDWTHVAMVYDGTDMRIYVNGVRDLSTPVEKTDPIDSSVHAVHIGLQEKAVYDDINDRKDYEGLIDEVQVLGRALSADEVDALYKAFTPPPRPAGLAFEDVSGLLADPGDPRTDDFRSQGVAFAEVNDDNMADYILALAAEGDNPREVYYRNFNNANRFRDLTRVVGLEDDNDDDGSHGVIWADLDNDGDYDHVNASTWAEGSLGTPGNPAPNNVYENDGTGVFTDVTDADITATAIESRGVVAFDMDGDGDLDLFSISDSNNPGVKEAYRNDGGFAFTPHVGGDLTSVNVPTTFGVTDTDYDGDGDVDILAGNRGGVAGFDGDFAILRNDGSGIFTRVLPATLGITDVAHTGITTADIDNDGDLDLLLIRSNRADLWRNDGGTYERVRGFGQTAGNSGAFADFDNDGNLDLVFAGDERVYLGNGAGGFRNGPSVPVGAIANPQSLAFADIDNDGDLDFAISAQDSLSRLIRNEYNGGNNWIKLQLIAANGQAGAFGAKAFVYRAGTGQSELLGMRESRSNQGYLSQDDPVLHFGLGTEASVDVVVEYVDGTKATCVNIPANTRQLISGATCN